MLALGLRVFVIIFFGDKALANEWGIIFNNYYNSGIFGFRKVQEFIAPNLFMPPLYPLFLILLKKINFFSNNFVLFVLYVQLIISLFTIYGFSKILNLFFNKNISLVGTFVFTFFPLNIYSVSQISSITLNIFLLVFFLLNLFLFIKSKKKSNLFYFSTISGLLILTRGEFLIFFFLALIYIYFYHKQIRDIFIIFLITLITLSPYLVRNYLIFEHITLTKSFGYNLWKGNNKFSKPEGYEIIHSEDLNNRIKNLEKNNYYDIEIDKIYKLEAIDNIKNDPKKYFFLYLKKLFSFFVLDFNSSYPDYYNVIHIVPKVIFGLGSFIGAIYSFRIMNHITFFGFFYISYAFLFSAFFILPRYSLILLPIQIILLCNLIDSFRLKRKN